MIQAIHQRDDLSFQSPSSDDDNDVFVDQYINKRVIDMRKQSHNVNYGQVVFQKNNYNKPQRRKPERYSQTTGYDWLLLYRHNTYLRRVQKQRQMANRNKLAYRQKNTTNAENSKEMFQISQTQNAVIKNRSVVHIATQNWQSDFNKVENTPHNYKYEEVSYFSKKDRRQQNYSNQTYQINSVKQKDQQMRESLIDQSILKEKNHINQLQQIKQPVKNLSFQSTNVKDQEQQFEVIHLSLSSKKEKKRQKQKKGQTIVIFNNQEQNQEKQFENNISQQKYQLNGTLNQAFLFGESWLYQENQLSHTYATGDLNVKYKGPIFVLKIKSFSLILGGQKVQIKLCRRNPTDNYECQKLKYKNNMQIVQNVFKGKKQYTSTFKQANFKLFLLKLPAKLQSFFQVDPQDLNQLKIQINLVSITCFCKHKFYTYFSFNIACEKCSLPSTIILDQFSIK